MNTQATTPKITKTNIALLLSDTPQRVRDAVADLTIGRNPPEITKCRGISPNAIESIKAWIADQGGYASACKSLGITLTQDQRAERSERMAGLVRDGVSVVDVAEMFEMTLVSVRAACRKHVVERKIGRPRKTTA